MRQQKHILILGSRGVAGRMHACVYRQLGIALTGIDIVDGPLDQMNACDISWSDMIVDICTPTGAHTESIAWAYARGARQFIVEKPAASSLASWRSLLSMIPSCSIFVLHPYLFSEALNRALDAAPDIIEIDTVFNKDREQDDADGRGADAAGALPHVLQVEAPHQFALLQYISPSLAICDAHFRRQGLRGTTIAPLDCAVTMSDSVIRLATLQTDLRAPGDHRLTLRTASGNSVIVCFSAIATLTARVELCHASGDVKVVFDGKDDLVKRALVTALAAMRTGSIPFEGSVRFASSVLAHIDSAMSLLDERVLPPTNHNANTAA